MKTSATQSTVQFSIVNSIRELIDSIGFHDPDSYQGYYYHTIDSNEMEPLIKAGSKVRCLLIPERWWYLLPGNVVALVQHDKRTFVGRLEDCGDQYQLNRITNTSSDLECRI